MNDSTNIQSSESGQVSSSLHPGSDYTRSPYYFSIRRPVAATMIVLTAAVFGLLSYKLLPINMMPEISYPALTVRTEFPGAAPEEVENSVSRPVEQALGVVRNMVEITSSSRAEASDVVLEFDWGTDMNRATQDVRERLDVVFLSEDVKPPMILRYDPSLDPLMRLGLTSDSLKLMDLRLLAEETIKLELEKLPGIAAVKIKGGEESEILIALDPTKLALLNIPMALVWQRLSAENVNVPGGRLLDGEAEYIIRALNEFRSIEEIGSIAILNPGGGEVIRLRDLATVKKGAKERKEITRVAGRESVEIEIYKESDANPITVSESVKRRFAGEPERKSALALKLVAADFLPKGPLPLNRVLKQGVTVHYLSDQAEFIKLAVNEVQSSAIIGGLLAVLIIVLFLGKLRDTLIIAVVIPVSLICTFAAMHLAKVSINLMSLGGLALGVGMLVDNSIVVIESIYRRRKDGDAPVKAAVIGTRIVGGAVIASTLTTVVVFFPIVFVSGVAGQVFGNMALTVIISLMVSLALALFYTPMLAVLSENVPTRDATLSWNPPQTGWRNLKAMLIEGFDWWKRLGRTWRILGAPLIWLYLIIRLVLGLGMLAVLRLNYWLMLLFRWVIRFLKSPFNRVTSGLNQITGAPFRAGYERFSEAYIRQLKWLLRHPYSVIAGVILLCLLSYAFLLQRLGSELIPNISQGLFEAQLALPVGAGLEKTAASALPIENTLSRLSGVEKVSSRTGGELLSTEESARGPNCSTITVLLASGGDLDRREQAIVDSIRTLVGKVPAAGLKITHPTLFTLKQPIEIVIKFDDLERLRTLGNEIETRLRQLPMLVDVESSVKSGYPEIAVRFDRDRLARLGLSAQEASEQVKAAVMGRVPTRFREQDRNLDLRVQYAPEYRQTVEDLKRIAVNSGQPIPVTLAETADLEMREGPSEIKRIGGARAAVISAGIQGSDLKTAGGAIRDVLNRMGLFEGYDYIISGQQAEMDDSLRSLKYALLLAIFLVYVVMASQFESLLHPFLVLLTIPLAIAFVIPALWVLSLSLSVMVFLGLIVLVGIVVNNSIVLVDYANQLRRAGASTREAVIEASGTRLRPILMTSLTTIIALIPMALGLGEGYEIRRPMAVTVMVGLSFATLITLFVIPVFYNLMTRGIGKPAPDQG